MSTDTNVGPGRDPGDLARYLDGELPPQPRERMERALASDPGLAASLGRMQEASVAVAALLARDEEVALPPPPDFRALGRAGRRRLAAAAIAVLVGAALVGVSPVGASLVHGLRAVAAWITGSHEAAPGTSSGRAFAPGSVTITAPAGGPTFRVRLDGPLSAGRLVVQRQDADDRIRATAGPSVELLFLRGELVVRGDTYGSPPGTGEPNVRLILRVPPLVQTVHVARPGAAVEELVVQEGQASELSWEPVGPG